MSLNILSKCLSEQFQIVVLYFFLKPSTPMIQDLGLQNLFLHEPSTTVNSWQCQKGFLKYSAVQILSPYIMTPLP